MNIMSLIGACIYLAARPVLHFWVGATLLLGDFSWAPPRQRVQVSVCGVANQLYCKVEYNDTGQ